MVVQRVGGQAQLESHVAALLLLFGDQPDRLAHQPVVDPAHQPCPLGHAQERLGRTSRPFSSLIRSSSSKWATSFVRRSSAG